MKEAQELLEVIKRMRPNGIYNRTSDEIRSDMTRRANAAEGDLKGFNCRLCNNRGYVMDYDEFGDMYATECSCMPMRRSLRRIEKSGLGDLLKKYTFENWQIVDHWQARAKELAERYVLDGQGWFLAAGRSGSGKSHLCTAICKSLLENGAEIIYMLWRDIAVQAKATVNDGEEYAKIVEPLKRVPVLYIDDLFKTGKGQSPTTADVNLAFEILNARYSNPHLMTVISTERTLPELMDIDEAVGGRIYERSKGYRLDFSDKPNWRLRR